MNIYESSSYKPFNFSEAQTEVEDSVIKTIISKELDWIDHFMRSIYEHLNERESQGLKIGQQDLIQCQIAEIASERKLLGLAKNHLSETSLSLITDLIRELCLKLARLAGARAFLRENVIEMLWTFEIINQTYLVG